MAFGFGSDALHDTCVISIGDKADFLAFGLVGPRQTQVRGSFPDLLLGQFAQRKRNARQLILVELEEEIRLVLLPRSLGVFAVPWLRSPRFVVSRA